MHGENFLNRFVVRLLDCEVFSVDHKAKSIETFFQRFLAKLQNAASQYVDASLAHPCPKLKNKKEKTLFDEQIGILWIELSLEFH